MIGKIALVAAASSLMVAGVGSVAAAYENAERVQTQTNWAIQVDGEYVDPGQEFHGTLRLNRNGEFKYFTQGTGGQRIANRIACGLADQNADVDVYVGLDGLARIYCG